MASSKLSIWYMQASKVMETENRIVCNCAWLATYASAISDYASDMDLNAAVDGGVIFG